MIRPPVASARRGDGERRHRSDGPTAAGRAAPLVALALAALAIESAHATIVALVNLQLDAPLVAGGDAAGPAATPPGRVLVVVIDGLRADVADELPFLRAVGEAGARATLWAETPSYSAAAYVAMLTGAPPRDSGVRTNLQLRPTPLDSVPRRLRAAGRRAVEIGDGADWWGRIFGADFAEARLVAPAALGAEAEKLLAGADLALVHLCAVDEAGHRREGAASPAYRAAARDADEAARRLARAWGWPAANVVILADHGHAAHGGHGGDEPDVRRVRLVAGGPGIRAGARLAEARIIDVAPTLAALLGTAAPGSAEGRTLVDALALSEPERAALDGADRPRIARALASAAAGRRAGLERQNRERAARGASLLGVLAFAGFGLGRARRRRLAGLGLLCGAAALALTATLFALRYGRPSFSADRSAERLGYGVGYLAAAAAAAAFAPAFLATLRGRLRAADAGPFALGAVLGASPLAALVFVDVGAFAPRVVCEPAWRAALPLCAYAAFAPPVLAAAILIALAALRERIRPAPG